ncbi:MAG: prolipoprotein diacylglyceryl transferase [Deltaproteobacteria bacterium]|nr:MAG: prolipoprotein diacylglyceryl transferase [Deltaproteobacteria bacterium]
MHPVLFSLGPVTLHTYGLFVALGFLAGIFWTRLEAVWRGQEPEPILDLAFIVLLAAIAGARLFYVIIYPEQFADDLLSIFMIWNGGLVFYGGFVTALIAVWIYLKKKEMPVWEVGDILAPGLALGHGIGRMGCFFAGCCYGKTCDLPWAVQFADPMSLAPTGMLLHPSQLYSVLGNLLLFVLLLSLKRFMRFSGQLFWIYVGLYGLMRSFLERFRGDPRGDVVWGLLSVSQFIGLLLFVFSLSMLLVLSRKRNAP